MKAHGEGCLDHNKLHALAQVMLRNFAREDRVQELTTSPLSTSLESSSTSNEGVIKINCDAEFSLKNGVVGVSFVMRCQGPRLLNSKQKQSFWAIQVALSRCDSP